MRRNNGACRRTARRARRRPRGRDATAAGDDEIAPDDATATARRRPNPIPMHHGPALADQARLLHHQGEPHLRSGVRRPAAGQRRSVAGAVRARRDAESSRAGRAVRAARQLLRPRRSVRARPSLVPAGVSRAPGPTSTATPATTRTRCCWARPTPSTTAPRRTG